MTDATSVAAAAPSPTVITAPADTGSELSVSDAARALSAARKPKPAESAAPATAEPELASQEADAAPAEQATGETQEAAPVEKPPRELPRSWTKEQADRWAMLDPELQDYLHEQDSKASAEVRRVQNEAAQVRNAAKAERDAAEQARKAYEAKLPALLESLQRQSPFADIKSIDDVKKMQLEDPFRFQQWQIYQMDAQAADQERRQAEDRQSQQKMTERNAFTQEQSAKLHELLPEMKDPKVAAEMRESAVKMLVDDYGFTEGELGAAMQTDDGFKLLTDARMQKLIADGLKLKALRSAPPKAIPKPVPPVQRPGAAAPRGAAQAATTQALTQRLNTSGDIKDAVALLRSRRAS